MKITFINLQICWRVGCWKYGESWSVLECLEWIELGMKRCVGELE